MSVPSLCTDLRNGPRMKSKKRVAAAPLEDPSEAIARQCRRLVTQRALFAAGVAMVPIPGLDWLTDVGILVKLLPEINRAFGLSPEQIEQLAPDRKLVVYKTLSAGTGMLVGRIVTRELVIQVLKVVGVRLTTQQAAKFVPIAGQAVSAMLTFGALKYVCEQHIRQCQSVSQQLALPAPDHADCRASRRLESRLRRGVAQPGSATALGAVGREFESRHPDHPSCLILTARSSTG